MAEDCTVKSLYNLAAFTTVRNCDFFKSEFRLLPNAVQCDIYRGVGFDFVCASLANVCGT